MRGVFFSIREPTSISVLSTRTVRVVTEVSCENVVCQEEQAVIFFYSLLHTYGLWSFAVCFIAFFTTSSVRYPVFAHSGHVYGSRNWRLPVKGPNESDITHARPCLGLLAEPRMSKIHRGKTAGALRRWLYVPPPAARRVSP